MPQIAPPHRLRRVVDRFGDTAGLVRTLALSDRRFRDVCDDLALALETLERFERRTPAPAELAEYRALVRELEAEVAAYLHARGTP